MAGFKPATKDIRLVFEDEYEGLEVLTRSVPLGAFMDMARLAEKAGKDLKVEDIGIMTALFDAFARDALIEWNLIGQDDAPVQPTIDGMKSQDTGLMLHVVLTWLGAIGGASGPLVSASSNGNTSDSLNSDPPN